MIKDNQHFRTLSQTLDQLNGQKITSNASHYNSGSNDLKSPSNDRQLNERRDETQDVCEDMSEDSDDSNGCDLRPNIKEEPNDNSVEPMNAMKSLINTKLQSLLKKSVISLTSQSVPQELISKDMSGKQLIPRSDRKVIQKTTSKDPMDVIKAKQLTSQSSPQELVCEEIIEDSSEDSMEDSMEVMKAKQQLKKLDLKDSDETLKIHVKSSTSQSTSQQMVNEEIIGNSSEESLQTITRQMSYKTIPKRHNSYELAVNAFVCAKNECNKSYKTAQELQQHFNSVHSPTYIDIHRNSGVDATNKTTSKQLIPRSPLNKTHGIISEESMEKVKAKKQLRKLDDMNRNSSESTHPYKSICSLNFAQRQQCFEVSINSYICPINECHKRYECNDKFRDHLRTAHSKRQYVCPHEGCGKAFTINKRLAQHSLTHRTIKSFKCDYNGCQYRCVSEKYLAAHVMRHSTNSVFRCDVNGCQKTYKSSSGIHIHRRSHRTEPTFKCCFDGCSEMFHKLNDRNKHQVMVHNQRRKLKVKRKRRCQWPGCDWMGHHLPLHESIHTGLKPYACDWPDCGKRFRYGSGLREHMNVHNNVKPHACHWPGCEYRAANSEDNQHFRTLSQTLDQLNGQKITTNDSHINTGSNVRLKSPSNDQQLNERRDETQDMTEDMFEDSDDSNGCDLRPDIKEELNDNSMEPMNAMKSLINTKLQSLLKKSVISLTSQSSPQELVCEDIIENSSEDSMEVMKAKQQLKKLDFKKVCEDIHRNSGVDATNKTTSKQLIPRSPSNKTHGTRSEESVEKVKAKQALRKLDDMNRNGLSGERTHPYKSICPLSFAQRQQCLEMSTKSYICPINECHKSYECNDKFRDHLRTAHSQRQYVCPHEGCGKIFGLDSRLTAHLITHRTIKSFNCNYNGCQFRTVSEKYLAAHVMRHSTDRQFRCDVNGCQKIYKSASGIDIHRRSHRTEPTFKCCFDCCSEKFHKLHDRIKHQVMVHNQRRKFHVEPKRRCQWPGCDWRGTHVNHHMRLHTGEKPFSCDWPDCGKRFRTTTRLKEHMNIHNNVKPYACHWPGCEYRAANSPNSNFSIMNGQLHDKSVHYREGSSSGRYLCRELIPRSEDNQHFRSLSQTLDQLNGQKSTTNDSHINTGSNAKKLRPKRLTSQEVIESNEDTISEDSDQSYGKSIKNKRKYTKRQPKVSTKAKTKPSISLDISHTNTGFNDLKSPSNDQQLDQSSDETQDVCEDMFEDSDDSNGCDLRPNIKEELKDNSVEPMNAMKSLINTKLQSLLKKSVISLTSQSSPQELICKDMSGKQLIPRSGRKVIHKTRSKDPMDLRSNY
ncbi:unnamed protein product [Medioppia subpectinata]|uniref:C2H2-type domain-containing protein n=1 Tax=Medioppia subpectinata TaxID=1979941 RepID=A0A7R9KIU5_9ACAR|nr:unnamed protein product [Medioppia subpectinata]CAG2104062.1 unnamed protein product [Medioppia subpectinata]